MQISIFIGFTASFSFPADLENAILTIRRDIFKETAHGTPGITLDEIDEKFVARLYAQPEALKA